MDESYIMVPKMDRTEINRCLLCIDAPCEAVCPKQAQLGRMLRAAYFDNLTESFRIADGIDCADCDAPCEKACILGKKSSPIAIKDSIHQLKDYAHGVFELLSDYREDLQRMQDTTIQPDLTMDICGVRLENPFLLSSSVVASTYDMCARAFEAGWAGACFKTICTFPQHEVSPRFSSVQGKSHAFYGFKNIEQLSDHSVKENLDIFRELKKNYPTKVIIASIMGQNEEEWTMLARECQAAGADVVECNFSCPNMESSALGVTIGQDATLIERFTAAARRGCTIPLLAKMTPNITDMVPMALAAKRGGADGIAAINTINSISGVDIYSFTAEPAVQGKSIIGGYSGGAVKPIALRFISDLGHEPQLRGMHISGMGGIETWRDAVEFIALGAGSLQITTAVMQYGYRIIDDLLSGLKYYLRVKDFSSVRSILGAATASVVAHDEIERNTVLLPRFNHEKCLGCGRCYTSCMDGGHQAIAFDSVVRQPRLIGKNCVGCHLCRLVCPADAIGVANKRLENK